MSKMVCLRLPDETYTVLRGIAAIEGCTVTAVIMNALQQHTGSKQRSTKLLIEALEASLRFDFEEEGAAAAYKTAYKRWKQHQDNEL